jgi:hypothetical protein
MRVTVQELNRSFVLHGSGGITKVQARLAEHGQCYFTCWEPCPPAWRVRFVTYLSRNDLQQLLDDVMKRFGIQLYQEVAVYTGNV